MAESNLSVAYADILSAVGELIGSTTSPTGDNLSRCNRVIQRGYRKVLGAYDWTMLKSSGTITFTAETSTYDLPDDFGSLVGNYFYHGESTGYSPITVTSYGIIRERLASNSSSGISSLACIMPKTFSGASGLRHQVEFYQTPSSALTVSYRYRILMSYQLDATTPYPIGGMAFGDLVMQSCLAEAEKHVDGDMGIHTAEYQRMLDLAIVQDRRNAPSALGYNGNGGSSYMNRSKITITVNGSTP